MNSDLISPNDWIHGVIQGGAIILLLFSLLVIFLLVVVALKPKELTKEQKLTLIKTTFVFFGTVLVLAITLELTKVWLNSETYEKHVRQELHRSLTDILWRAYDPQFANSAYRYILRAPNGYLKDVQDDPPFQDFGSNYLVQRLWADPRGNGYIKANRVSNPNRLRVEFVRDGWGCDVTIKQRSNRTAYIGNAHRLVLELQAEAESLIELKSTGAEGIGFRIRVVDGRNNHWGWGERLTTSQRAESVKFSDTDSEGKRLVLADDSPQSFHFDITSRKQWAFFNADGGIAPRQTANTRFDFVQLVVIETGVEGSTSYKTRSFEHERNLGNSPIDKTSKTPVPGVFFLNGITFE